MGVEADFDFNSINSYMEERLRVLDALIVRNLNYLGMQCVVAARQLDTYKDRTANLRNSIGYLVLKNGNVVKKGFESNGRGTEYSASTPAGEVVGEQFAKEVAENFKNGYVLIVVAGMNYASYVEDVHGLDVLKSAENFAIAQKPNIVSGILNSMQKRKW